MKNNHEIANFLCGKLLGNYRNPDLLHYMDLLEREFPSEFSPQKLSILDIFEPLTQWEFYFTTLNKAHRLSKHKYYRILMELKIPDHLFDNEKLHE